MTPQMALESAALDDAVQLSGAAEGSMALAGSRVGQKLYFPSALLMEQMPAGLGAIGRVPRLMDMTGTDHAARVEEYVEVIRKTAKVFEVHTCQQGTLEEHDKYMVWLDGWACLSDFGKFVEVDATVRARPL